MSTVQFQNELLQTHQALAQEWKKGTKDANTLKVIGDLLEKLKVALTHLQFLPTGAQEVDKRAMMIAREVLEIGALYSIEKRDIPGFERYLAQLKTYYFDYKALIPESAFMYQLLGLNLMCLLSQNRLAEFHTEMELLPSNKIHDIYIFHPVQLEQYIMEGNYNRVFLQRANVPAHSYDFFMDILFNTIRKEIGECLVKAYDRLALEDAMRLLFFQNQPKEFEQFVVGSGWTVSGRFILFNSVSSDGANKQTGPEGQVKLHAEDLALQAIDYALQLEMIV